jgi:phosphatidylglycerol:prolipoprotein diacylglycerol transferase
VYPRLFELGPVSFPAYGFFAAVALVGGLVLAMRLAARSGLRPDQIWNAGLLTIFVAAFSERLLLIAGHWHDFLRYPMVMLSIAVPRTLNTVLTRLALGAFVGLAYLSWKRIPWLPALDVVAPAFALGQALLAVGCFFAGCDYGRPTGLPWGVTFHSRWALLWNGTPLGIPLHPVQLYFCLVDLAILAVLLAWFPRRRQPGEIAGLWLFLAGLSQFFLGFFLASDVPVLFHATIGLSQALGFAMVIAGCILLLEQPERATPSAQA